MSKSILKDTERSRGPIFQVNLSQQKGNLSQYNSELEERDHQLMDLRVILEDDGTKLQHTYHTLLEYHIDVYMKLLL